MVITDIYLNLNRLKFHTITLLAYSSATKMITMTLVNKINK